MKLKMIGCSHHTADMSVRERLAFSPEQVDAALKHWLEQHADYEAVLLSTCNRTELYIASDNGTIPENEAIFGFLYHEKTDIPGDIRQSLTVLEDREAVRHLFSVAGSLDSMVVGESQILSQVKSAYKQADDNGVTGPITHSLFQSALNAAKGIDQETQIHKKRISIPSVAVVDFALQIFERLEDKKTVVFGAGEMAEETLRYLVDHGTKSITILNRNSQRAEDLASRWNGNIAPWDHRLESLVEADLVISTTGATEPVVRLEDYQSIKRKRKGRSLFILDLAMPRDFDPSIAGEENVYLYSIDDLKTVCEKNRTARDAELITANKIVAQKTDLFFQEMQHHKAGTIIRQLRADWENTKNSEWQRLLNRLPDLEESEKEEIRHAFDRLVNKLLHPPLESLKDESKHGVPHKLLEALTRLFRLKD